MEKKFTMSTREIVMGYKTPGGVNGLRTGLHLEFSEDFGFVEPEILREAGDYNSKKRFNAVGSRLINSDAHLPLVDADHSVEVDERSNGRKAVLFARGGKYGPNSYLRDVLENNEIELEVFTRHEQESVREMGVMTDRARLIGPFVTALVLRAPKENTFFAVSSTRAGHGHLYIQKPFSDEDHKTFIEELEETGVISKNWADLSRRSKMGILRTPWTKKEIHHSSLYI